MGRSSILEIKKGIYDVLIADITLMGLVTGVFDKVPKTQEYPYIELGQGIETKFNTFDRQGRNAQIFVNIYSQYEGFKEALEILDRVVELLDYTSISLTIHDLVYIRYESGETNLIVKDEGDTKHVMGQFNVIVQE